VSDRVFIDTDVFIYAQDDDEPTKQAVAQRAIEKLAAEGRGVVSTQVLMEYVAVARRRLGLSLPQCRQAVLLMTRFDVVLIRTEHVLSALDLATTYGLSSWDGLILRTASASGCRRLLTEDLQHGQSIDGVRIENPFAAA
jgi:predicted nucleic acid-binding protein